MSKKLTPMAIAYDFDGTLAAGNMQEHSFLPEIGIKPKRFWTEVRKCAAENDMDHILAYMHLVLKHAQVGGKIEGTADNSDNAILHLVASNRGNLNIFIW